MPRFIAFLRGVNVGGARTVKMQVLRELFTSLGFSGVTTFIASGNIVFDTTKKNTKALEGKIKTRLREALGFEVATFVRADSEMRAIANYRPFPQSTFDASNLYIIFLSDSPDEKLVQAIVGLRTDNDEFQVRGREIYWRRRRQQAGSPFSTAPLEKTIGLPFTIRGAKTVYKIAEKYCSAES